MKKIFLGFFMEPKKTFFSERLKKIMFEKHITQKELADKLGFIQQRISFWATGRTVPTVASIKKIAAALDVPVNYFIEENAENNEQNNVNVEKNNNFDMNFIMKFIDEKMKRLELEIELIKKDIIFLKNR